MGIILKLNFFRYKFPQKYLVEVFHAKITNGNGGLLERDTNQAPL